ncbi:Nif3-like dinuclear metal center hexameric protein [Lacticaseibacillus zhaodongensis]|uniref:Nif3-like dinuclear metal center hexameric protein n=1 Tax=Lacticaseibacillus zhaodongensis TaxID=2668065 RepID=UPI0012D36571|nr:Nif3-like dinuclear metal center hexameric protein [Lacticaseibacillus zhaodongensis]
MTSGLDVAKRFEKYAPRTLAVPGDPIGWQLGNPEREVHKILVTLDVRPEVVREAIRVGADMIFAHHPAMFVPAHNLDLRVPQNAMYAQILNANILVYAAHTNLDNANPGMNDWLAKQLGLKHTLPFIDDGELRGMGRIGEFDKSMSVRQLVELSKDRYNLNGVRVIANDLGMRVKRVAVLGGSGSKEFMYAKRAGADAYITGDVTYHTGHDMLAANFPVLDVGHHVEQIMKHNVCNLLTLWAKQDDWPIMVVTSKLSTEPFTFL